LDVTSIEWPPEPLVYLFRVIEHYRTSVSGERQTFRTLIDIAYYLTGAKKGRYPITLGDNPLISRQDAKDRRERQWLK
jgi:hypothetical protein